MRFYALENQLELHKLPSSYPKTSAPSSPTLETARFKTQGNFVEPMNQINQHIAIYYDQHAPPWVQCAGLIQTFQAKVWRCVYIQDEHPVASVQAGLQSVFKPLARHKKAVQPEPSITLSSQYGFQNAPVRIAPIMAAFRNEVTAALEGGAGGVLFLVEMT
jgi:hypothetical protein